MITALDFISASTKKKKHWTKENKSNQGAWAWVPNSWSSRNQTRSIHRAYKIMPIPVIPITEFTIFSRDWRQPLRIPIIVYQKQRRCQLLPSQSNNNYRVKSDTQQIMIHDQSNFWKNQEIITNKNFFLKKEDEKWSFWRTNLLRRESRLPNPCRKCNLGIGFLGGRNFENGKILAL